MNNTTWNLTSASDIWRDIFVSEKEWERKKELIVVDCNEWCFLDGGNMLYNENKSSVSSVEYFELWIIFFFSFFCEEGKILYGENKNGVSFAGYFE